LIEDEGEIINCRAAARRDIPPCLVAALGYSDGVQGGRPPYDDVLVIDSGSSDETVDIVKSFETKKVRLQQIPNGEFQHGRTRNLGIASTEGAYIALLTQDALPSDRHWLAKLIGGFALSPHVAGVIGRHIAYPEHGSFLARDLNEMFDRFADYGPLYSLGHRLLKRIQILAAASLTRAR
jgi:glycosyltransferase involved in cell wall biosynthesis